MKMARPTNAVIVGTSLQVSSFNLVDNSCGTSTCSAEIFDAGYGDASNSIIGNRGCKRSRLSRSSVAVCEHSVFHVSKKLSETRTISMRDDSVTIGSVHESPIVRQRKKQIERLRTKQDELETETYVSSVNVSTVNEKNRNESGTKHVQQTQYEDVIQLSPSDFAVDPFENLNSSFSSSEYSVNRADDTYEDRGNLGIHVIAVLENTESYREPFDVRELCNGSFYPLVVTLCTAPLRIARSVNEPLCPELVPGAVRVTTDNAPYCLWEIPVRSERLVDFATFRKCSDKTDRVRRREIVRQLVRLIIEYKVVYLRNVPQSYNGILQDVWTRWANAIAAITGMRSSVQGTGDGQRDSVGASGSSCSLTHR